jgi:hypothetical protein
MVLPSVYALAPHEGDHRRQQADHGLGSRRISSLNVALGVLQLKVDLIWSETVAEGKWISYLRVSTDRQGKSGLGLEAQRSAVADYLNGGKWSLVKEFMEVESGKRADRPMLAEAIKACRVYGAKLVIAKLDRLSRDAHFLLGLEKAGVDFVAADMPNANRLTVGIMAMVAEEERRMISKRTRDACPGSCETSWHKARPRSWRGPEQEDSCNGRTSPPGAR